MEPSSFAAAWAEVCASRSSAPAIYSASGAVLRTFQQIEDERAHWRTRLRDLPSGQAVLAQLGNDPSWPALFLACLDRSLVIVPVEAELAPLQVQRIIKLCRPAALIQTEGVTRLPEESASWSFPEPDMLKITSGSTGQPRAVRVREQHLLSDCRNICQTMNIGPNDLNFGVISFSHSYGFSNLITPLLLQGTALVCASDRMPRAVCEQIAGSGATVFPGTPTLFQAVAALPQPFSLGKMHLCISAGAPLSSEVNRSFHRRFGLAIHTFYGSSECGGIAYDREGRLDQPTGFVGRPMEGVRVQKLVDDRIRVSGPNVADGYFPEANPEILADSFFQPADLIKWTGDLMQIYGRAAEFINVGGRKFHPSIVEEHLRKLPGVWDALAFGTPSRIRNEDLIAYVAGDRTVSRNRLEAHCRQGLNSWEVPREFIIVEQLPVDSRGKISRSEMAARYRSKK
jgi:long-chain acyl-CoA synthetase